VSASAITRRVRRRWVLCGVGLLTAVLVVLAVGLWLGRTVAPPKPNLFLLPPITSSPFLNTKEGVDYVGSTVCVSCHQDSHASFCKTGMGRSLAKVDPASEPPDGAFEHPLSKRRYQVSRKDGQLWHRELLGGGAADGPEEVLLAEYPVPYVVGSGRHARTYLVEAEGFLVESPVTWYASRQAWDLSPGYDRANQPGFTRAIGESCLFCHAGHAEAVEGSIHRMRITEATIGCERCHGPGALHVERQRDGLLGQARGRHPEGEPAGTIDLTIVNPAHLSRDLAEAVCQQCHLNSDATATVRGRNLSDFRPGLRLQDFREVYVFQDKDSSMTVVGHVQQMHLSRCYQATNTFSCLTCHDPHGEPAPQDRTAHYKSVCLTCHSLESCTVSSARRKTESPENDCVHCHMPRSATDIPHLAFTHHRVGIHNRPPPGNEAGPAPEVGEPAGDAPELQPCLPLPALSEVDRKLALGQAYRTLSIHGKPSVHTPVYERRALDLLAAVRDAGLQDPDLEGALAQLRFDSGVGDPLIHAERALAFPNLSGQSRCDALFVKALMVAEDGKHAEAIGLLRELTHVRREVFDWLYLSNNLHAVGDDRGRLEALAAAIRINPRQWDVHRFLAKHYRELGDAERAAWHERRAVP
jgi:predicted CXXCH cytochrome family protein